VKSQSPLLLAPSTGCGLLLAACCCLLLLLQVDFQEILLPQLI